MPVYCEPECLKVWRTLDDSNKKRREQCECKTVVPGVGGNEQPGGDTVTVAACDGKRFSHRSMVLQALA